jgi:hypothetical protein
MRSVRILRKWIYEIGRFDPLPRHTQRLRAERVLEPFGVWG